MGTLTTAQAAELAPSPAALRKAHALRDTLNTVFAAVVTGGEVPWHDLRPYAADASRTRPCPTPTR